MRELRLMIGLMVVCFAIILFLNPIVFIHLIDNKEHTLIISEGIESGNATETLNFTFNKEYISNFYKINGGETIYLNYINVFIDDFKIAEPDDIIEYYILNNNMYVPQNESYQTSLMLIEGTLNSKNQQLVIYKDSDLAISKITMDYIGADYMNYNNYNTLIILMCLIIFMGGFILCIRSA